MKKFLAFLILIFFIPSTIFCQELQNEEVILNYCKELPDELKKIIFYWYKIYRLVYYKENKKYYFDQNNKRHFIKEEEDKKYIIWQIPKTILLADIKNRLFYQHESGLFFLIDCKKNNWRNIPEQHLYCLQDPNWHYTLQFFKPTNDIFRFMISEDKTMVITEEYASNQKCLHYQEPYHRLTIYKKNEKKYIKDINMSIELPLKERYTAMDYIDGKVYALLNDQKKSLIVFPIQNK
ncbi:MAG: hypothetical protein WDZ41_01195 [Candidatus Babeliales bacterium]